MVLQRAWVVAVAVLCCASPAGAQEIGPVAGMHVFADDLELGVADDPMYSTTPKDLAIYGLRFGVPITSRLSVEAEGVLIPTTDRFFGDDVTVIGARIHGLFYFTRPGLLRPFVLAGAGAMISMGDSTDEHHIGNDTDLVPHWGLGLRIQPTPRIALRLEGRHLLSPSNDPSTSRGFTHDFEAQLGFMVVLGGETVRTRTIVVEKPVVVESHAAVDSDGDYRPDDKDTCPHDAEDLDGFDDQDGCPDPDNDHDGILDAADKCREQAENRNGVEDDDGCPEIDGDADGFFGAADECPDHPEDKDGWQDNDGCPDPDNDGDGVPDVDDQCAKEAESKNGYKDNDGCADELPKEVAKYTGVIAGITFKKDSAEIKKSSFKLLDRAAKTLKQYPELNLTITGHTSDEGDRDHNIELSLERAEAVKAYLTKKGIAADRLFTAGKGPDDPIAKGKSKKARNRNRRIEFAITQ